MKGSTFYLKLMESYTSKIAEATKEKEIYENVIDKLTSLTEGLPDIKDKIVSAENDCANGGFIQDGEPYGQGRFKEYYTSLQNDITTIEGIILSLNTRLNWLISTISSYQSQYDIANSNYLNALKMENGQS